MFTSIQMSLTKTLLLIGNLILHLWVVLLQDFLKMMLWFSRLLVQVQLALVHKVHKVLMVFKAHVVSKVFKVYRVLVYRVHKALKVTWVFKVQLVSV